MLLKNVLFSFPYELTVPVEECDVLSVEDAHWFAALLRRISDIHVDSSPVQEDWGVVFFVERHAKQFWIGLNYFGNEEYWAHIHHVVFRLFQRWSRSGRDQFESLVEAFHKTLIADSQVSNVRWCHDIQSSHETWPTPNRPD